MNKNFATQKIATKFDKFHLTDHQNLIGASTQHFCRIIIITFTH